MRLIPLMLSLSLVALAGCEALFTAPNPGGSASDTPDPGATPRASGTYLYVMNGLAETVDEIDLGTLEVTSNVMTLGKWPNQLLSQGTISYAVNSGDANLFKLDLPGRRRLATIELPVGANPLTLLPLAGEKALAINYGTADVAFLDLAEKKVEQALKVPHGLPSGAAAVHDGKAYVAATVTGEWPNTTYSAIHVIDLAARTVHKTISLDANANPGNVTVSPSGEIVVGVRTGLAIIDPALDAVSRDIALDEPVRAVQYLGEAKAYGAVAGGLVSFDPRTWAVLRGVGDKIAADVDAVGAFKIFEGVGYVSSFEKSTVTVIDLATEAASGSPIPVGDGPQDLSFVTVTE